MKQTINRAASGWLLHKSRKQLPMILLLSVLNMVAAACSLWLALLTKDLIDAADTMLTQALPTSVWDCISQPLIARPALLVIAIILLQVLLNIISSNIRVRAICRLEMTLKRTVFRALMRADYTAVYRYHTGELMNRLTADVALIASHWVGLLPSAVSMLTRLVGGLIVLTAISPWFTVGVIGVGALVACLSRIYGKYAKRLHKLCQETNGKTRSFLQEVLGNLLSVKAFDSQQRMEEKLDEYQRENYRQRVKRNAVSNFGNTGVYLVLTATYYVALLCGVVMMIAGTLSVGTLAALLQIFEQIQAPLRNASGLLPQYYSTMASAERLSELENIKAESATPLPATTGELFHQFSQLVFHRVAFAYDEHTPVVNGLDFTLKRGEVAALIGESGIGKSTIIKLILSILLPQDGEIVLQCDTKQLPVDAATRVFFSYVPQGNTVLSGTLRENIVFFRSDIADERVNEVLRLACLEEFVESLPEGLDAVIGEHGYGVSEGQAQRIAIARALLNDAPILLLDECTSALDIHTETQLLSNIRELTDKTVLMVSHKTTAMQGCDRVLRLADGKLIEENKST